VADLNAALRLDPQEHDAWLHRGNAHAGLGNYAQAVADLEEAVRLDPDCEEATNALAWQYATCPDAEHRNGPRAVQLAGQVCKWTKAKDAGYLDTLAAAMAECGSFEHAIRMQKLALNVVSADERADFESRLTLYEAGKPYREER